MRAGSSGVSTTLPMSSLVQSRNRPPALLAPPMVQFPLLPCGCVQSPGTRCSVAVTAQINNVVPHITWTSPTWSAPETSCSHITSTQPMPRTASLPLTLPTAVPGIATSGSWLGSTPTAEHTEASHFSPSNSDPDANAVPMSTAPTPPS